jgi:hypothetical protein
MKAVTLILAVGLLAYAGVAAENCPIVDTPNYKGVIIPAESAARDEVLSVHKYSGFWTPTLQDIAKVEESISSFMRDSKEKYASREYEKKWFRRQYVGYTKGAEKFVLCNFLPGVKEGQDPFQDLREHVLISFDAGPDYWEIHYGVEKDRCERLRINSRY